MREEQLLEGSDNDVILRVDKIAAESAKAIGVKDTKGVLQWFPKSQIAYIKPTKAKPAVEIRVPKWLAEQKDNFEFEED